MVKVQDAQKISKSPYFIKRQPSETSCGATSLHSVYKFYKDKISINTVIDEIKQIPGGGTLAPFLGVHALKRGYGVRLYTLNMKIFDPTWFSEKHEDDSNYLIHKLEEQAKFKKSKRLKIASKAYVEFLRAGGKILFKDLDSKLLQKYLHKDVPIITGLSSTYLYRTKREFGDDWDDVKGVSSGHFVVLYDYDEQSRQVCVADPYSPKQMNRHKHYQVKFPRLVCSILLGVLSYDANLLVIQKKKDDRK